MKLEKSFNLKRFFLIFKTEIIPGYKAALIAFAAIGGLLFVINISSAASFARWNIHLIFYPIVLFLAGLITTSFAFKEMHGKERGYAYLTLPGSRFEKYAAKLLLTGIGMVITTLVLYLVVSLFSSGVTRLAFGYNHGIFNPFEPFIWKMIAQYIVVHSVFFLGAVFFKRLALLKTVLSLTVLGIGLNIFAFIVYGLMLLFTVLRTGIVGAGIWNFPWFSDWSMSSGLAIVRNFEVLYRILLIIYYLLLPPFLWVTGFFRYREKEAR